MSRYIYCLVRCVPNPRTGEFVNYGAIAGDPITGDWSLRQVSSESHVRKLADVTARNAVHSFLSEIGEQIEEERVLAEVAGETTLTEAWLADLYAQHRNVVQLTAPTPMVAENAEQALDLLFKRLIIDPVSEVRDRITKTRVVSDLREAYRKAHIDPHLLRERPELYVGGHVHTVVDFAIGNGRVVQLTQAWSFQRTTAESISTDVKSWAYALGRLRTGEDEARLVDAQNRPTSIAGDVDLEVVVAPPKTTSQEQVYEEARQVFGQLRAQVTTLDQVDLVGARAADLITRAG